MSQFTGHVAVGVGHMGLVSTETHLHLASRYALDTTASVVLSGLPPLARQGGGSARQDEALRQWGELLRLSEATFARPFGELSQGQQKLAIIARALIGAPELVIMDEACQVGHPHDCACLIQIMLNRKLDLSRLACTYVYSYTICVVQRSHVHAQPLVLQGCGCSVRGLDTCCFRLSRELY